MIKERNAVIKSAIITNDDHGMLSAWVHLDYGGAAQDFGGYNLYSPSEAGKNSRNRAGLFFWRVMQVVGVTRWHFLKGKSVRVKIKDGFIHAIGHIIDDNWFCPSEEFNALSREDDNE